MNVIAVYEPAGEQVAVLLNIQPAPDPPASSESFSVAARSPSGAAARLPSHTAPILAEGLPVGLVVDTSRKAAEAWAPRLSGAANFLMQLPGRAQVVTVASSNPPAVAATIGGVQDALRALDTLRPGGEPGTAAAITLALRRLPATGGSPRLVVLFTAAPDAGGEPAADLVKRLLDARALLAVVSTAPNTSYWSAVASGSGGAFVAARSGDFFGASDTVVDNLHGRYQLTFPPPQRLPATVSVQVRSASGTLTADVALSAASRPAPGSQHKRPIRARGGVTAALPIGLAALVLLGGTMLLLRARIAVRPIAESRSNSGGRVYATESLPAQPPASQPIHRSMTERPPLFRQEAIEFHAGGPGQGGVLRIESRWTRWSYWIVLALVVAGVVVTATTRTSETTSGPALVNVQERTFVALVPAAASPDLQPGQLVRLHVDDAEGRPLAARVLSAKVADEAGVRRTGFASSSQPAVLVTGVLAPHADVASLPSAPRHEGRAVVVLRSERILTLFLQQLRGTLGRGGDS